MVIDMFDLMMERMERGESPPARPPSRQWSTRPMTPAQIRNNESMLVELLRSNGCDFRSNQSIKCPICRGKTPTAEIVIKNGVYALRCHATECRADRDYFELKQATTREFRDR